MSASRQTGRLRVLHLITDLATGGAEMMLLKLVSRMDRDRFEPVVVSLRGKAPLGHRIEAAGIPVHALGVGAGGGSFSALRVFSVVRALRPAVLQGWMPHGNLAAGVVGLSLPGVPVLFNVRQTIDDLRLEKPGTRVVIRAVGRLAARADRVLYNSRLGAEQHEAVGYPAAKRMLLPNGFDCERFRPSPAHRAALRAELRLGDEDLVVSLVGRYHPMKGHDTFLHAAALIAPRHPRLHFVLAGRGVSPDAEPFRALLRTHGLEGRVHLLGEREDTERIHAAADVGTLSSLWGEGFPNVVGEAMACGLPCAVTDVGDAAWVVGEHGIALPPADPEALAGAWETLIRMGSRERRRMGEAARRRVLDHFSLESVVARYEALYASAAAGELRRPQVRVRPRTPGLPAGPAAASPGHGAFVVSLDFELHWGVRDLEPPDGRYRANLLGARAAVPRMLELFEEFGVRATWATVGMLMARSRAELERFAPRVRPGYHEAKLSPYGEPMGAGEEDDPLHYAEGLVARIRDTPGQEVGSHTFSHYYCLEPGQTRIAFQADLAAAVAVAEARGVLLRSLVFPRNQVNERYLDLLPRAGFVCYRGNQAGRFHAPGPYGDERRSMRAARLADAYLPLSGSTSTPWTRIACPDGLACVPASAFLRPYDPRRAVLERRRIARIVDGMRQAAFRGEVYHLWWHPHNFGIHLEENLAVLRRILAVFSELRESHGMRALSMHEVARMAGADSTIERAPAAAGAAP